AVATSWPSCSAACRLFFSADLVTLEKAVQSRAAAGNAFLVHPGDDLVQRQIRLLGSQAQKPIRMLIQRRDASAHRLRRYAAGRLPALKPFDRRARAHVEPFCGLPPRRPGFNLLNQPHAQVLSTRLRHRSAPRKAKPTPT